MRENTDLVSKRIARICANAGVIAITAIGVAFAISIVVGCFRVILAP